MFKQRPFCCGKRNIFLARQQKRILFKITYPNKEERGMKVMTKVVFGCCLVILMATVSGCYSISQGTVSTHFKSQIAKGKTTKVEVLQELGNPDQKIDLGDGKQQFSYIKEEYKITPLSCFSSNAGNSQNIEFWLAFDADNTVADFGERPTTKAKNYFGGQQ